MLRLILLFVALVAAVNAQATRQDAAQNIRHAGGTKTPGQCLVWDNFGLVTQATCGAGGGETNAGANLGAGAQVYTTKSGVNLQFRSFTAGSNKLSVTQNTNDIALDVLPANITLASLGGTLSLSQIAQGGATTGQLLQWNGTAWVPASTGGGGGPANTDALAEGSTNLYYTQARARAALSVAGILSYNNGTGVFSCSNCADITSSYANPSWISSLAWAKLTGVPTYQLSSEKGAANGYASLGAGGLVPVAQLGSGTANSTVFLRGDGTWTNPAGSVNLLLAGTSIGTRPGLNLISSATVTVAAVDDAGNNRVNITPSVDTTAVATRATVTGGTDNTCIPASGSGTTFTCSMVGNALTAYTNGMRVMFRPDAACSGTPTLNINTLGAKKLFAADGTTGATCSSGLSYWLIYNSSLDTAAGAWTFPAAGSGGVSSVSGTTNEITSTGGATPVLSLSSTMNLTSKTVRVPNGTSRPVTCTVGDSFMDTDATTGQRWYLCESTDTWVAQGASTGATKQIIQLIGPTTINSGSYLSSTSGMTAVSSGFPPNGGYPNSGTPAMMWPLYLPSNWASATAVTVRMAVTERSGNSGTYRLHAAFRCLASGATFNSAFSTGDYNTSSNTGLVTRPSGNQIQYVTMTSVATTGCVAGEMAYLAIWRDNSVGTLAGDISPIHAAVEIGVQ